jgi:hypothetical protein
MAHLRSLGFPGFPVKSCGFGQLHVVLFRENHISGAVESCDVGNPGTLGMTKKERAAERRGPLPRARAVVGAVGTSISSPFCAKSKRVTTSQDDKKERVVEGERPLPGVGQLLGGGDAFSVDHSPFVRAIVKREARRNALSRTAPNHL